MLYQHWFFLSHFTHSSRVSDSLSWCDSLTTVAPWPPGAGDAAAHLPSTYLFGDSPRARMENDRISRAQLCPPEFRRETETVPSIEARQTESLRVPYSFRSSEGSLLLSLDPAGNPELQTSSPAVT